MTNMEKLLKRLQLTKDGRYEDSFYIIDLEDSDEYAKMYSHLCTVADNEEYPGFQTNTNGSVVKITNYYRLSVDTKDYRILLFANFEDDTYYLKIKEPA